MIEFIEYGLSGGMYVLFFIICIICSLACIGIIADVETAHLIEIEKKKYEMRAKKEKETSAEKMKEVNSFQTEVQADPTMPVQNPAAQPILNTTQSERVPMNSVDDSLNPTNEEVPDVLVLG